MNSLNIGLFGNNEELLQKIANALGKKGTTSDITLYDTKNAEKIITAILPHSYPDKIQSLFYAINLCDFPILAIETIDSGVGEIILSLDAANFNKGIIFSKDYNEEQIKSIIKGTTLENYEFFPEKDENSINDLRLAILSKTPILQNKEKPYVAVDHSFSVKGVGTVVLGLLKDGAMNVYDKIKIMPVGKNTTIKSIQKHDDNFQSAEPGDRVGLCLKDVSVEDVPRGAILSNFAKTAKKMELNLSVSRFAKDGVKTGQTFYVVVGLQYISCKIVSGECPAGQKNKIELSFEKDIAYLPGQRIFLINPNLKMKFVGVGDIENSGN